MREQRQKKQQLKKQKIMRFKSNYAICNRCGTMLIEEVGDFPLGFLSCPKYRCGIKNRSKPRTVHDEKEIYELSEKIKEI